MTDHAEIRTLSQIRGRLAPHLPGLPPPLKASLERHAAQVTALVARMNGAGLDEPAIRAAVGILLDVYEKELVAAIEASREDEVA